MKTSDFWYDLPDAAIAQSAIEPRHASRLLDTRDMSDHRFQDLPLLLEPGDLVVVNQTKVRRARLRASREPGGGSVELLILRKTGPSTWVALAKPARRLRAGSLLSVGEVSAEVLAREDGVVTLRIADGAVEAAMDESGEVPLPPYFRGVLPDDERYQTIYADRLGSAAAPTAGLHFTREVLRRLEERGVALARIDLEIGLDTFVPIRTEMVEDHRMHSERVSVGSDVVAAVESAQRRGGRVVAIGTTVVRALETAAASGSLHPFEGDTNLFIAPGFDFAVADILVTNFHVPSSSLVVLVAAFMGGVWRDVYTAAIERGYRFLSFGDAMVAQRAS